MNRAGNPYSYVADPTKGRPLFNADLYFGVPNLDPQIPANQISVSIQQEDGTIVPVSQPVETGAGGVPMYNGSPAIVLISQDTYSFKAIDRLGGQAYYQESAEAFLGAGEVVGSLENYAAVRALNGSSFTQVSVAGHTAAGDGGKGVFVLKPSDVVSSDNGATLGTILVSADGGRWHRVYSGRIAAEWGESLEDSVIALAAAGSKASLSTALTLTGSHITVASGFDLDMSSGGSVTQPNTGDNSAFHIPAGASNVTITGGGIYGPYTASTPVPVAAYPASSGGVRITGTYDNIVDRVSISEVEIGGWGTYGVFAENCHNSDIHNCHIHKIGRDGFRGYGVKNFNLYENEIHNISPGLGGVAPNLNVYGITYTRNPTNEGTPLVNHPPSRESSAHNNYIYDCPTWKGLDTHGGVDLTFAENRIYDCYINIGVDEGDTSGLENAPPINIKVINNDVKKGSGNSGGAGINVSSSSATNMGSGIEVRGNTFEDCGDGTSSFGAMSFNYVDGGIVKDNYLIDSNGTAFLIPSGVTVRGLEVGGNIVHNMVNTIAAYSVGAANAQVSITSGSFIRTTGTMIGFNFATPAASYGVSLGEDIQYFGTVTKFTASSKGRVVGGMLLKSSKANGRITSAGALSGNFGISSVSKTGTGVYEVTLSEALTSTSTMYPQATARETASAIIATASPTSTNVVTVRTFTDAGAAVDAAFSLNVLGY